MDYCQAHDYLYGLVDYERTPARMAVERYLNLDRMREALDRAGNPERGLRFTHIAGTKGKGSTAAMLDSMLRAAGLRVGLFTKPHLVTFRERLRLDGAMIGEAEFAALTEEIVPVIEGMRGAATGVPTFFEAVTLLAFLWFARYGAEVVVLETGMGGRLDSTNVVTPLVTAITRIALDHTEELGETTALIAAEKAGIIKPGVPVVSAPQEPDASAVIAHTAAARGCALYRVGEDIRVQPGGTYTRAGQRFSITGRLADYPDLACPLLGAHQQVNAATAIGMAECLREAGLPVTPAAIRAGLAGVVWPGRLQIVGERPLQILDGAHDPAAIEVLLRALDDYFPGMPRRFILGFAREKDWRQMLRLLAPSATAFILTAAATPRAVPPEELAELARDLGVPYTTAPDVPSAIRETLMHADGDDLICLTGSLYVVGEALRADAHRNCRPWYRY